MKEAAAIVKETTAMVKETAALAHRVSCVFVDVYVLALQKDRPQLRTMAMEETAVMMKEMAATVKETAATMKETSATKKETTAVATVKEMVAMEAASTLVHRDSCVFVVVYVFAVGVF